MKHMNSRRNSAAGVTFVTTSFSKAVSDLVAMVTYLLTTRIQTADQVNGVVGLTQHNHARGRQATPNGMRRVSTPPLHDTVHGLLAVVIRRVDTLVHLGDHVFARIGDDLHMIPDSNYFT